MPVSGLVVTLSEDDGFQQETIDAIVAEPRLEIGYIRGQRMAVVMDTRSADEDKELWSWLTALPAVLFVDVTLIGFEGDDNDAATETANPLDDQNAIPNREGLGSVSSTPDSSADQAFPPSDASPQDVKDSVTNDRSQADILVEDSQDVAPTEAVSVPFSSHKPTRSQE